MICMYNSYRYTYILTFHHEFFKNNHFNIIIRSPIVVYQTVCMKVSKQHYVMTKVVCFVRCTAFLDWIIPWNALQNSWKQKCGTIPVQYKEYMASQACKLYNLNTWPLWYWEMHSLSSWITSKYMTKWDCKQFTFHHTLSWQSLITTCRI